jgi:hypothetical protein
VLPAEAIRASAGDVAQAEEYLAGSLDRAAVRWRIETRGDAAWALARYREAQTLLAGIDQQAAEWTADVAAWRSKAAEPLARTLDFMGEHLRSYALALREQSGNKVKTVELPGGRIETTGHSRPRICVDNEEEFTVWVKENQAQAIKMKEEAKVSLLTFTVVRDDGAEWGKLTDPATGEIIPGVHAEWAPTSAEVKV